MSFAGQMSESDELASGLGGRDLWQLVAARGLCARVGADPDQWYPVSASAAAARREAAGAIAVCAACTVRVHCLELALRYWSVGQHGVWGGTVPAERAALRRALSKSQAGHAARDDQAAS